MRVEISDATLLAELFSRKSAIQGEVASTPLQGVDRILPNIKSAFLILDLQSKIDFLQSYMFDLPPNFLEDLFNLLKEEIGNQDCSIRDQFFDLLGIFDAWFGSPTEEELRSLQSKRDDGSA